jgi:stage V sporulation protein B
MDRDPLIQGTLLLTGAMIINSILGAIYRIPLSRLIGDEGMGLYQMASPVYGIVYTFSTCGLPLASSKLIAERIGRRDAPGALRVFRISLSVLIFMGSLGSLFLYLGARFIAEDIIKEPRTYYALISMAPSILLMAIDSAFHSLFRGMKLMAPSAFSGVMEQVARVLAMLALGYTFMSKGIEYAAAGIALGTVSGGVAGILFLLWSYFHERPNLASLQEPHHKESLSEIMGQLISLAFPLMLGRLLGPLTRSAEATLIPMVLRKAGLEGAEVVRAYGQLTGMAMPLLYFPTTITSALSVNLMPMVASLATSDPERIRRRGQQALRLNSLIGFPTFAFMLLLAEDICQALFATPEAGVILRYLAPGAFLIGLIQITGGLLHGFGDTASTTRNRLCSTLLRLWLIYSLGESLGIRGVALAYTCGLGSTGILNLMRLSRKTGRLILTDSMILRPGLAALLAGASLRPLYLCMLGLCGNQIISLLTSFTFFSIIYLIGLLMVHGIHEPDILLIPRIGSKLARILEGAGLLR